MSTHHVPVEQSHGVVFAPTTRLVKWTLALVAAWVVFALGVFVTPGDSVWAVADVVAGVATGLGAAVVAPIAVFRCGERSIAVYVAVLVLLLGVLLVLLHPLFISD